MNQSALEFCPVPQEQQPEYEYQQLQDSWFLCWPTLPPQVYLKKILCLGLGLLAIAAPIAAASFPPTEAPLHFILSSLGGSGFLTTLFLLRLYLGWSYLRDRLYQAKISYEESGWYDGQIWEKPQSMLNRDRLIVTYEIQPILWRLQKTFLYLGILGIVGSIIWLVF
ncbi:MAG: CGLD27 family protein [Xenococcus sp. MO_188.B8]|nr:CGLD27 family protein [Xenococcus sp. MO_188.B8]